MTEGSAGHLVSTPPSSNRPKSALEQLAGGMADLSLWMQWSAKVGAILWDVHALETETSILGFVSNRETTRALKPRTPFQPGDKARVH